MLRRFRADLHVHTCLSPCGDLQMSPQKIAAQARRLNIEIIGVCDHNTAENVPAVMRAGEPMGVVVLPGMEVCTREEIHILAIFGTLHAAIELQALVYDHLSAKNDPDIFGLQVVANEFDEVVGFQEKLLIGAADVSLEQMVDAIHRLEGIAIASHIDRESYSVISQLGFIPDMVTFDALELTCHIRMSEAQDRFGRSGVNTFIRNSDAHVLEDLGKNMNEYLLEQPTFEEIRKALRGEQGRMVCEA
jgi:PHP family Zn ribbon phosphoesterase